MNYIWDNIYHSRLSWAKKAEIEFKQNLQKLNIDELLLDDDFSEITIGVYGPTQVGKTTLILTLLGIKEEWINTISGWLRGKRSPGDSSTVTATEYRRSENHLFSIFSEENGWKRDLTREELEQALFEVRAQVEHLGEISTDQIVIEIGDVYFDPSVPMHSLNFVDLPGIQSAEPTEQRQVMECVKRWLPLCEMTLLVEDATRINDYAQIEDHNVKFWMNELDRFRIIPTHALSLESVVKDKNFSGESIRDYYAEELSRSLNWSIHKDDLLPIIFPVEIGRTLLSLQKSNPSFFEYVHPMMEQMIHDLRIDLIEQKPEVLHFKRLASLYSKAERFKHEEVKEMESLISQVKKASEKQEKFIKQLKKPHRNKVLEQEMVISEYENVLDQVTKIENEVSGLKWQEDLQQRFDAIKDKKKRASIINNEAANFKLAWENELEQKILSLGKTVSSIEPIIEVKKPFMEDTIHYLTYYKVDFYLSTSNFTFDIDYVKKSIISWLQNYIDQIKILSQEISSQLEARIKNEKKKASVYKKKRDLEITEATEKLSRLMSNHEKLQKDLLTVEKEWQQELEHCQNLDYYFQKNAVLYYQLLKTMLKNGTAVEKWQAQHLLFFLHQDSEMVTSYFKGKELQMK